MSLLCVLTQLLLYHCVSSTLLLDLQQYVRPKWLIIYNLNFTDGLKLGKSLAARNVYITLYPNMTALGETLADSRPMEAMVVMSDSNTRLAALPQVEPHWMSKFTWILLTNPHARVKFSYIPFDCQFVLATQHANSLTELTELYHTSPTSGLYSAPLGFWNAANGLTFTKTPFDERRSSLFGQNVTVLNETKGIIFHALPSMMSFYPDLFSDILRRMNMNLVLTHSNPDFLPGLRWYELDTLPNSTLQVALTSRIALVMVDLESELGTKAYGKPFSPWVWSGVWLTTLLFALAARRTATKTLHPRFSFLFKYLSNLFQKDEGHRPASSSERILNITFWYLSIMLFSLYSAVIIAFVTVKVRNPPFKSLEELLADETYHVVSTINRGYVFFKNNKNVQLHQLFVQQFEPQHEQVLTFKEAFEKICARRTLVTEVPEGLLNNIRASFQHCPVSQSFISVAVLHGTWHTAPASPYRRSLSVCILKLIAGGCIPRHYWKKLTMEKSLDDVRFNELPLTSVALPFYVLLTAWIISLLILLLELVASNNSSTTCPRRSLAV